jgi:DNA-binding NarL/FixJ family response regulator
VTGQSDTEESEEATLYSGSINAAARILVVDEHARLRKMLVDLVKEKTGIAFCLEAETADVASKTVDGQAVDFALVDISSDPGRGARLAELLRLRCPKLPVMSVTIEGKPAAQAIHKADISPEQIETILAGIRYMQSLIRAGLSGFTVCIEA